MPGLYDPSLDESKPGSVGPQGDVGEIGERGINGVPGNFLISDQKCAYLLSSLTSIPMGDKLNEKL